jgi:hypothetical protein
MPQAFIIMQIGNPELDRLCQEAIVPALRACGFDSKRVDKHNQGGLLKSEIIGFIQQSEIIVADLTNERPNCYLEVGYAMGLDKFSNLVLTARDDHNQDSPKHFNTGPKVHFDLRGYDVLFWDPGDLATFRAELEKRIRRRVAIIRPPADRPAPVWDEAWLKVNSKEAHDGLLRAGFTGYCEILFALPHPKISKKPSELLQAAEQAQIHTFGWPIGIVVHDERRPRPVAEGIIAEIPSPFGSYDYWTLRRNGDFYLLKSLFEDQIRPGCIFYDTRITRTTEALLYCARLYTRLEVPASSAVHFGLRFGGLKGRVLSSSVPGVWPYKREAIADEIHTTMDFQLSRLDADIVGIVKNLLDPLFELFEFYQVPDERYAQLVNNFVTQSSTPGD